MKKNEDTFNTPYFKNEDGIVLYFNWRGNWKPLNQHKKNQIVVDQFNH